MPNLGKGLGICIGKKPRVQAFHNLRHVVFFDHERQIDFRGPLGNHPNLYIRKLAEDLSGYARPLP